MILKSQISILSQPIKLFTIVRIRWKDKIKIKIKTVQISQKYSN